MTNVSSAEESDWEEIPPIGSTQITSAKYNICDSDLNDLQPGRQINDSIIDWWFHYICTESQTQFLPCCFYPTVLSENLDLKKEFIQQIDMFKTLLIPIHYESHYFLAVFAREADKYKINVYDSIEHNLYHYRTILVKIWKAFRTLGTLEPNIVTKKIKMVVVPRQEPESNDCGPLLCYYCEQYINNRNMAKWPGGSTYRTYMKETILRNCETQKISEDGLVYKNKSTLITHTGGISSTSSADVSIELKTKAKNLLEHNEEKDSLDLFELGPIRKLNLDVILLENDDTDIYKKVDHIMTTSSANNTSAYKKAKLSESLEIRHIMLYWQSAQVMKNNFLQAMKPMNDKGEMVDLNQNIINAVAFFVINTSVYCITSNQGYRMVEKYSDDRFLEIIPNSILSLNKVRCYNVRCITGAMRSKTHVPRTNIRLKDLQFGDVCRKFSSNLSNKKIHLLFLGNKKTGKNRAEKHISVDVSVSGIKFNNQTLNVEKLSLLLSELDKIFEDNDKKPVKNFNRILIAQSKEGAKILDKNLADKILTASENKHEVSSVIDKMDFCHSNTEEFSAVSKIMVYTQKVRYELTAQNFTLRNILKKVPHILKNLQETTISYHKHKPTPLLDYLCGEIEIGNRIFWKLNTDWYAVSHDYFLHVEDRFRELLTHRLVSLKTLSKACLMKNWVLYEDRAQAEAEYNLMYQEDDFLVGDGIFVENIELCDLLRFDKLTKKSYLFHVKESFGRSIRDLCSQIRCAADFLSNKKAFSPGTETFTLPDKYLTDVLKQSKPQNVTKVELSNFFGLTGDWNVTFVMGIFVHRQDGALLTTEKDKPLSFTKQSLKEWLEEQNLIEFYKKTILNAEDEEMDRNGVEVEDVVEKLINILKDNDLVTESNNEYYITYSILMGTKVWLENLFKKTQTVCLKDLWKFFDRFRSSFDSLIAKLEVLRLVREMDESKNFSLKICEIKRDTSNSKIGPLLKARDELVFKIYPNRFREDPKLTKERAKKQRTEKKSINKTTKSEKNKQT